MSLKQKVIIRPAVRDDFDALCELYYEFHQFHVRGVPDRLVSLGEADKFDSTDLRGALQKILDDDDAIILAAEVDERIVGLAEVYVKQDEAHPLRVTPRYGDLQSLIVNESYRRYGIGRELTGAAEKWAKEKGAVEMQLDIWEFGAGPLDFYNRLGYRTIRRKMVRKI